MIASKNLRPGARSVGCEFGMRVAGCIVCGSKPSLTLEKLPVKCFFLKFSCGAPYPDFSTTPQYMKRYSSEENYCSQSHTSRSFHVGHHFSRSILNFWRRIFFAAARPMPCRRLEFSSIDEKPICSRQRKN